MTGKAERYDIPERNERLNSLLNELRGYIEDPIQGLPEEVFLFLSEISPLPNVDLLVQNEAGQILLAWRNDPWWGPGWHVPGGIIRVKETFEERIEKTARAELGTSVIHDEGPIEIHQIINKQFKERGHHITFVFSCKVPDNYQIDNRDLKEHDTGYLAWHDHYPEQMLKCHTFYRKYFR